MCHTCSSWRGGSHHSSSILAGGFGCSKLWDGIRGCQAHPSPSRTCSTGRSRGRASFGGCQQSLLCRGGRQVTWLLQGDSRSLGFCCRKEWSQHLWVIDTMGRCSTGRGCQGSGQKSRPISQDLDQDRAHQQSSFATQEDTSGPCLPEHLRCHGRGCPHGAGMCFSQAGCPL